MARPVGAAAVVVAVPEESAEVAAEVAAEAVPAVGRQIAPYQVPAAFPMGSLAIFAVLMGQQGEDPYCKDGTGPADNDNGKNL